MPVHFIADWFSSHVPSEYYASIAVALVAASVLKTWAAGPKLLDIEESPHLPPSPPSSTSSSSSSQNTGSGAAPSVSDSLSAPALRDLHGRVVLVASGAFTPLGVVTLAALAHRGAHIIALTPTLRSPRVYQLISLLRSGTNNELIYAEQCDLADLHSVSTFAAKWNQGDATPTGPGGGGKGGPRRLDILLFLPSEENLYSIGQGVQPSPNHPQLERAYVEEVLARFHLLNAILPSILLLPPERDIRIVSAISPWYAAGVQAFDKVALDPRDKAYTLTTADPWQIHGATSLRWYALMRELQNRLHLLAEADARPRDKLPGIDPSVRRPVSTSADAAKGGGKGPRRSNVSVICIATGFERNVDVLAFLAPPRRTREVEMYPPDEDEDEDDDDDEEEEEEEGEKEGRAQGESQRQDSKSSSEKADASTKLRAAIDPRRPSAARSAAKRSRQSQASLQTLENLYVSSLSSSSSRTLSRWISRLSMLVRYVIMVVLWPVVWLLCQSPSTASESIVWALTKRVESDAEFLARGKYNTSLEGREKGKGKEEVKRQIRKPLVGGELYRGGRIVRPALPQWVVEGGWARLWSEEELRVEKVVGKVRRPGA